MLSFEAAELYSEFPEAGVGCQVQHSLRTVQQTGVGIGLQARQLLSLFLKDYINNEVMCFQMVQGTSVSMSHYPPSLYWIRVHIIIYNYYIYIWFNRPSYTLINFFL